MSIFHPSPASRQNIPKPGSPDFRTKSGPGLKRRFVPSFPSDCQRTRRPNTLRHHKENLSTFEPVTPRCAGNVPVRYTGAYSAFRVGPRPPRKNGKISEHGTRIVDFSRQRTGAPGTTRCVTTGAYSAFRVGPWTPKSPLPPFCRLRKKNCPPSCRDSRAPAREYGVRGAIPSRR